MKKIRVLVAFLTVAGPMIAQEAQAPAAPAPTRQETAPSGASRGEILQLFKVLRLQKQMEEMQKTMTLQMQQIFDSMSKEQAEKLTPSQRTRMDSLMKQYLRDSQDVYPVSEMISDMVPVYQRNLTSDDVHAISVFYESPAGQRYLDKQPRMLQDTMATIMPKMQERLRQQIANMTKKMQQAIEETQSAPPTTKN